MTDEMKKHMKNARRYVSQGGCRYIDCIGCGAYIGNMCRAARGNGCQGMNAASDSQIQWFHDFIKENEGTESAPVKKKVNKIVVSRRVIQTDCDGNEYEEGKINGMKLFTYDDGIDDAIKKRDLLNQELANYRKLINRHDKMQIRGEFK